MSQLESQLSTPVNMVTKQEILVVWPIKFASVQNDRPYGLVDRIEYSIKVMDAVALFFIPDQRHIKKIRFADITRMGALYQTRMTILFSDVSANIYTTTSIYDRVASTWEQYIVPANVREIFVFRHRARNCRILYSKTQNRHGCKSTFCKRPQILHDDITACAMLSAECADIIRKV